MEVLLYYFPSSCTFLHSWNSVQEFQFFLIFSNAYFLFFFFFESSHLNGREIFIFQSVTLTYLYLINVILGSIPAVLFYVFNVLCLFPDSLHPFPIFCWVDWGFLFFFSFCSILFLSRHGSYKEQSYMFLLCLCLAPLNLETPFYWGITWTCKGIHILTAWWILTN